MERGFFCVICAWLAGVNLLAFCAFGLDKRRARRGLRRIPEARLLLLAALGGSCGAWLGMLAFRHKTRKLRFRLLVPLLLLLQLGLAVLYYVTQIM